LSYQLKLGKKYGMRTPQTIGQWQHLTHIPPTRFGVWNGFAPFEQLLNRDLPTNCGAQCLGILGFTSPFGARQSPGGQPLADSLVSHWPLKVFIHLTRQRDRPVGNFYAFGNWVHDFILEP
jgi:hypothetical protein